MHTVGSLGVKGFHLEGKGSIEPPLLTYNSLTYKEFFGASQMALVVKNPPVSAGDIERLGFSPRVGKIPWRRAWQPTSVFLPRESLGQRNQSIGLARVGQD